MGDRGDPWGHAIGTPWEPQNLQAATCTERGCWGDGKTLTDPEEQVGLEGATETPIAESPHGGILQPLQVGMLRLPGVRDQF